MPTRPASGARLALAHRGALLLVMGCGSAADPQALPGESTGPDPSAAPESSAALCSTGSGALGQGAEALSVVDRALIGQPAGYAADTGLRRREIELERSRRARREVAWSIAARVLAPVPLAGALGETGDTLPAWQTWHNKDDVTRIFRRLYPELSPEDRASRAPFDPAAIDQAWLWNDGAVADFDEWSSERLAAYRAALDSDARRAGAGGIYRVAYSPEASRHLLGNYGPLLGCRESEERVESTPPLAPPDGTGCGGPSFTPACLTSQFSPATVLVKASWQRLGAGTPIFAFDTSAEAMERRLAPDGSVAWGEGDRPVEPGEDGMYTLELPNGNRFGLTGLHIMTKELEHWVWLTLWWSDRPNEDFGADRPGDFPSPFAQYKLCSVVSFAESDPDPEGGFGADAPSLARALAVTQRGAGAPTWCSNPYIEQGDGNAGTNCIGCHQHAGTRLRSEDILADAAAFPDFGRTEQRVSFPSDYVFSVRRGDDLGAMFVETEDHYAAP